MKAFKVIKAIFSVAGQIVISAFVGIGMLVEVMKRKYK